VILGSVKKGDKREPIIDSKILPSLNDGWISGFTDGRFTVSFLSNSNAFRLRFILTQKKTSGDDNLPMLSYFIQFFQGKDFGLLNHIQ
jgi:hypothetical protein